MGSIIASFIGWLLGKLLRKEREKNLEGKYAKANKENVELRMKNTGLRVVRDLENEERGIKDEWVNADKDGRYEILKRDFDDND